MWESVPVVDTGAADGQVMGCVAASCGAGETGRDTAVGLPLLPGQGTAAEALHLDHFIGVCENERGRERENE